MIDVTPTGCPGVDTLLEQAQLLWEQPELADTLPFSQQVEELQLFRRRLEKQFRESLRLAPRSPLQEQLSKQFDDEFERFRSGGRRLEAYLKTRQRDDLETGCQRVRQAICLMLTLSAQLRAQEESWREQYGPGLAGEVRFLIEQTRAGNVSYQQASQIFERTLDSCRSLEKAVASATPESDLVAEQLQRAAEALGSFSRVLARAVQSLRQQHSWEIEERLEELLAGLDELGEVHRQLMEALMPPVTCPHCGQTQPGDRPFCACGGRLPLPVNTLQPVAPEDTVPRFQSFVELEACCDRWLRGESDERPVLSALDPFIQRIQVGSRNLARDSQLDEETRKDMIEATGRTESVLLRLRQQVARKDQEACVDLLDDLKSAEQAMLEARQRAQEKSLQSTPNS